MHSGQARASLGVVAVLALVTAGCGTGDRENAAGAAARRFSAAVEQANGESGCALLAPPTRREVEQTEELPCSEALPEQELPDLGAIRGVAVYGLQAQVRGSGDTIFLTDLDGGWRVMAAGCVPQPDGTYDCTVKGD